MSDQQEAPQSGTTVRKPDGLVGKIARLEKELAAAKAKNTAFEARLAALESGIPKRAPVRPEPPVEGTTVTTFVQQSSFIMPSNAELLQLQDAVLAAYPLLGPRELRYGAAAWEIADSQAKYFEGFTAAFQAIGALARTDAPDHRHYLDHFTDHCETWLRSHGIHAEIGRPFMAACLAHGDVPWRSGLVDGQVWEVGLNLYGVGRRASDKWKNVLRGQVLAPVATRMPLAPASPARVFFG